MKNFGSFFLLILFISGSISCRKQQDVIPNVSVNIYLNISSPTYSDLNAVGGAVYSSGGVKGIITYRKSYTEFMAYDRNCTYLPSNACAIVSIDKSRIMAIDSCCGSVFLLTDGSVTKGPAVLPLKAYQTSFDGNIVHIYN